MAGPWEKYGTPAAPVAEAEPWRKYGSQPKAEEPAYSGSILPFSKDAKGNVSFDSNAGLFGMVKRAFTLPGEVYKGEIDPRSDEGIRRAVEMGTVVSPVNPGVRAGEMAIPGLKSARRPVEVKPPTAEALLDAGGSGFDAARKMGVDYSPKAVQNVASSIRAELEKDGILGEVAPTTFRILKKLENPPKDAVAVTIAGLHAARRTFGEVAKDFNKPSEQAAASRVIAALDKFLSDAAPESVVAGPAAAAAKTFNDAKGNYAAAKRSDLLQGIEEKAGRRAAAANSGRNVGNTIRSRVASVLESDKKTAGFSEKELAELEAVSRGSLGRNTARKVGNLFGGGGGFGMFITGGGGALAGSQVGGLTGMMAGLGLPAMGYGAKSLENALTRRALTRADEMVRQRSPLFEDMQKNAGSTVADPALRSALIRALLLTQQGNAAH